MYVNTTHTPIQNNLRNLKMADESMLDNTSDSTPLLTNPYEIELQALCKRTLKHRLFRGYYMERRYVENIKDYRDVVSLHKSEKSLGKTLRDIRDKLQLFYSHQNSQIWIGITSGNIKGLTIPQLIELEDTYLWVDAKDLAFGQYLFSIKTISFLDNEIILTLREAKPLETETVNVAQVAHNKVTLDDFVLLLQQWQQSIKHTVYNFMSQDISKQNITHALKFLGLVLISLISFAFVSVKYLGVFFLRFISEVNRFIYVSTPIVLKLMDVFIKIVGGFFILLAMIWKDVFGYRNQPKRKALQYNSPTYRRIQYDVRH